MLAPVWREEITRQCGCNYLRVQRPFDTNEQAIGLWLLALGKSNSSSKTKGISNSKSNSKAKALNHEGQEGARTGNREAAIGN